jgi:hypothetical protein
VNSSMYPNYYITSIHFEAKITLFVFFLVQASTKIEVIKSQQ